MPKTGTRCALAIAAVLAGSRPAGALDPPPVEPGQLAGNTLSAVAYVRRPPGNAGGGLQRLMLQAYLAADGTTLVREWLPERDGYSVPRRTRWSLTRNRLCVEMPSAGPGTAAEWPLCA